MTAGARKRERLWRSIVARSVPGAPDFELLDRWRGGDHAAGEELCRRHDGTLRGFFATKCGGGFGELVERTLRAAAHAEDGGGDRSSFRAFLFTHARQELHRHLQQRRGAYLDFSTTSVADILAAGRRGDGS